MTTPKRKPRTLSDLNVDANALILTLTQIVTRMRFTDRHPGEADWERDEVAGCAEQLIRAIERMQNRV